MTDIILESKDGKRLHYFIDDSYPAIVYVREGATLRVKASTLTDEQILALLRQMG